MNQNSADSGIPNRFIPFGYRSSGVAAIGMTAIAAGAMTLAIPGSFPLLSQGEGIVQTQYWGGDNEDWRYSQRWRGGDDEEEEEDDDD